MFDEWAKAIQGANGTNSGNIYQNYARAGTVDMSSAAKAGKVAASNAAIDEVKRKNAEAAAEIENRRKSDEQDPSKAQMRLLPDNAGYAFYDGTGKRININQFALLTGKRPDEILSDSPNPKDQKFVQDYKTLTAFTSAWVNGDKETLAKMRAADPEKFNTLISNYQSPSEVVKAFTQHWADYYGGSENKQGSATGSFAPQNLHQPDKKTATALAATDLGQILTPQTVTAPRPLQGIERFNPFAGQRDEINRFNTYTKSNPWFAYHSSLMGQ